MIRTRRLMNLTILDESDLKRFGLRKYAHLGDDCYLYESHIARYIIDTTMRNDVRSYEVLRVFPKNNSLETKSLKHSSKTPDTFSLDDLRSTGIEYDFGEKDNTDFKTRRHNEK